MPTTLPTGTVTFLFTDIAGSTALWERDRDAMQLALAQHDALLRIAIESRNGHVFKTVGVARLEAAGHGGQVLVSLVTQQLVRDRLPDGCALRDWGVWGGDGQ